MKTASATITKVDLSTQDARWIVWKMIQSKKGAVENLINEYLTAQGAVVRDIKAFKNTDDMPTFKLQIEGESPKVKKFFPQEVGFVRSNMGFGKAVKIFLVSQKGEATLQKVWEQMSVAFPKLAKRNFDIYIRDTRLQKTNGFRYNPSTKKLSVSE